MNDESLVGSRFNVMELRPARTERDTKVGFAKDGAMKLGRVAIGYPNACDVRGTGRRNDHYPRNS